MIADLSEEAPVPSMLVKVVDSIEDKKDHDFQVTLLVAHPLLGVGILIWEVIKVPAVHQDECPEKVTNQWGQQGV